MNPIELKIVFQVKFQQIKRRIAVVVSYSELEALLLSRYHSRSANKPQKLLGYVITLIIVNNENPLSSQFRLNPPSFDQL